MEEVKINLIQVKPSLESEPLRNWPQNQFSTKYLEIFQPYERQQISSPKHNLL